MNLHVTVLGRELMQAVTGILYDRPTAILPVVTDESSALLPLLNDSLRLAGRSATILPSVQVDPFMPGDVPDQLQRQLDQLDQAPESITVNWTGGTKIMAYGLRTWADTVGAKALYVNTERYEFIEERPGTAWHREYMDVEALGINLPVMILAGANTLAEADSEPGVFATRHRPPEALVKASRLLHDAPAPVHNELKTLAAKDSCRLSETPEDLRQALINADVLMPAIDGEYSLRPDRSLTRPYYLVDPEQAHREFLRGIFFELFVYDQLRARGSVALPAWHVQVNPHTQGRGAEYDVLLYDQLRLVNVECKSGFAEVEMLRDMVEETSRKTRLLAPRFSAWVLVIRQTRKQLIQRCPDETVMAEHRIRSYEARAKNLRGQIVFGERLDEVPHIADELLQECTLF